MSKAEMVDLDQKAANAKQISSVSLFAIVCHSDSRDKLWVDVIPLQFTAKKAVVHGVKRFHEIEVHRVTHSSSTRRLGARTCISRTLQTVKVGRIRVLLCTHFVSYKKSL